MKKDFFSKPNADICHLLDSLVSALAVYATAFFGTKLAVEWRPAGLTFPDDCTKNAHTHSPAFTLPFHPHGTGRDRSVIMDAKVRSGCTARSANNYIHLKFEFWNTSESMLFLTGEVCLK